MKHFLIIWLMGCCLNLGVFGQFSDPVIPIEVQADRSVSIEGNLIKGEEMPLNWASSVNVTCFPDQFFPNFGNRHMLYGFTLPAHSRLTIDATPIPDGDVNLYALQFPAGVFDQVPPGIDSVMLCDASFPESGGNPGKRESVYLSSKDEPSNILVGVSGPVGVEDVPFKLDVIIRTDKPDISAAESDEYVLVREITLLKGEVFSESLDLEFGQPIQLDWAQSSQVGCFDESEFSRFEGNHFFYRIAMPPMSRISVTVQPESANAQISLYAFLIDITDSESVPPNIDRADFCKIAKREATDSEKKKGNAEESGGQVEPLHLEFTSQKKPYNMIIGIAGAKDIVKAGFRIEVLSGDL